MKRKQSSADSLLLPPDTIAPDFYRHHEDDPSLDWDTRVDRMRTRQAMDVGSAAGCVELALATSSRDVCDAHLRRALAHLNARHSGWMDAALRARRDAEVSDA